MLTFTFDRLIEKLLFMSKSQVTSYEKLTQLNSSQTTPTSYHLTKSHYRQAFRTPKVQWV